MCIVDAGRLFAPPARRRAVTTRRPTLVLFDSIDDSQRAHGSQKSGVQAGEVGEGVLRIDGICRNDIIPSS